MSTQNTNGTENLETSLVVFTCEGREHLLLRSFESFLSKCKVHFKSKILVIDGQVDQSVINKVQPDFIIQSTARGGYVKSIINALKNIETDYFFWLEDDFIFNKEIPLNYMQHVMASDKTWAGIFLSRFAPITQSEKSHHYFDDLYKPDFGFSVSPTLCNTNYVRNAFNALIVAPKSEETKHTGFEPFINDYFESNNLKYAILDPGDVAHVEHFGYLESTAREYHMINSIDNQHSAVNKTFISGLGKERVISIYSKISMLPKLWLATIVLSFSLLKNRASYDFAFRIYAGFLKNFKY